MFNGFKNLFNRTDLKEDKIKLSGKQISVSGTSIADGYISEELNPELDGVEGIRKYIEMRDTDGSVGAKLKRIKLPILQARWYVAEAEDEPRAEEHAEFIEQALFEEMFKSFDLVLWDILHYIEKGVQPFEKVYKVVDGSVFLHKLSYIDPRTIDRWQLSNGKMGIIQLPPNPIEGVNTIEVPWDKLLIFWNSLEGENYWGCSELRGDYKHWYFKDAFYRIQAIANERWGVGIPVITLPENSTPSDVTDAEEMGANIRAHNQAVIVKPSNEWDVDILTGGSKQNTRDLMPDIMHHDRQIAKSSLAQSIELGQMNGSQALAKVMEGSLNLTLKGHANYIASVMNELIKELINLNFDNVEQYPKLKYEELSQDDLVDKSLAYERLFKSGAITYDLDTENFLRNKFGLPDKMEGEEAPVEKPVSPIETPIEKPTEPVEDANVDKKVEDKQDDEKVEGDTKLSETKKKISKRERDFIVDITTYEKELEHIWSKVDNEITKHEEKLKAFLLKAFKQAKTINKNGALRVQRSGNYVLQSNIKKGIGLIMQSLSNKISDKEKVKKIMQLSAFMADKTYKKLIKDDDVQLAEISSLIVPTGVLNSYISGYTSNLSGGFIYNSERQVTESIMEIFGSEAPYSTVGLSINNIKFNRNIAKLSTVTHARGLFKDTIATKAEKDGYMYFKYLVPTTVKDIDPKGDTARNLFIIGTVLWWSQRRDDKNPNPVSFSMHHNSQEYYLPIREENLEEEKEISKYQRQLLKNKLT